MNAVASLCESARKIALDRFRLIQPTLSRISPCSPLHVPRAFLTEPQSGGWRNIASLVWRR